MSSRAVDCELNVNEPTVCIKYVLTRVSFRNMHKARLNVGLLVTCDWFVVTQPSSIFLLDAVFPYLQQFHRTAVNESSLHLQGSSKNVSHTKYLGFICLVLFVYCQCNDSQSWLHARML